MKTQELGKLLTELEPCRNGIATSIERLRNIRAHDKAKWLKDNGAFMAPEIQEQVSMPLNPGELLSLLTDTSTAIFLLIEALANIVAEAETRDLPAGAGDIRPWTPPPANQEEILASASFGERTGKEPALSFQVFHRASDASTRMRILRMVDGKPEPLIELPMSKLEMLNLGDFFTRASHNLGLPVKRIVVQDTLGSADVVLATLEDKIEVRDEVAVTLKPSTGKWTLEGYSQLETVRYMLDGAYDNRLDAEAAAEKRLALLAEAHPDRVANNTQDLVFINVPDGGQYRYFKPKKKEKAGDAEVQGGTDGSGEVQGR